MVKLNNEIKFNNETIKNAIMDALDKKERGIEINEVDRNELIDVILKYGDRDFGIKNKDTGKYYIEEELQNSIYIHIVNENNKCYIGQTSVNPERRWRSDGSGYEGQVFYNPIKYYGWDNISHIVLCYGLSEEEVNKMEIALISLFKSTNREEFGYNVSHGGNVAGKHSEETRQKMSEARKGKQHSEEHKNKISEALKGKPCSEETRKKISESLKGKHHSEETRKKLSEANKGENNYWYGKHLLDETRKKMSEAKKGKYVGEKHPMYGKHLSEETKKKISEKNKGKLVGEKNPMYGIRRTGEKHPMYGKHHSEEARKKMSDARKGKYKGENSHKAKKVCCDKMIFPTITKCAEFYNVKRRTMNTWLQDRNKMPSEFIELGFRYATEEDISTYPLYIEESKNEINEAINVENNHKAKVVFFNGMIFSTVKQFAKFCNVSTRTMSDWLNGKYKRPSKLLSKLLEQGLRFATQEDIEKYPPYIEEEQN